MKLFNLIVNMWHSMLFDSTHNNTIWYVHAYFIIFFFSALLFSVI